MLIRNHDTTQKVARAVLQLPYVIELRKEAERFDREVNIEGAGYGAHQERVGMLSLELGYELGLKPEELFELGRGAFVHDNWKAWINNDREYAKYLATKPGPLTPQELLDMRTHTREGFNRVNDITGYTIGNAVIVNHHDSDAYGQPTRMGERRTSRISAGRRNPEGLEETLGQIVAAADIVDPLIFRRPYNAAQVIDVPRTFSLQFTGSGDIANAMLKRLAMIYPHAEDYLRSA